MSKIFSRIIGTGMTKLNRGNESASILKQHAVELAIQSCKHLRLDQLDGLITVPSLAEPRYCTPAHFLATKLNIVPSRNTNGIIVRTLDTGGASPVSALLEADRMIKYEGCSLVAIVAGDAVLSMETEDFLRYADIACGDPDSTEDGPVIPKGYNKIAEWQIAQGTLTREQLAMVSVLMSRQAARHPYALTKRPHTLHEVLHSPRVADSTNLLECARRADGAAAVIVASPEFIRENLSDNTKSSIWSSPVILGGGEASGALYPPQPFNENFFTCKTAAKKAYKASGLTAKDIDYFGLYDCFPICFIKALEGVGLAEANSGGRWVEDMYNLSELQKGVLSPDQFPVNTHGGLLAMGSPWEAPAMFR
mmetsp:Transcript_3473/g.3621  ORF Transcript_3473/g.3621 Transcript_3473/m.3621 type:complete len:365 (+) Transcript_3473:127-1221(+)